MNAIRIKTTIESETLHLPELKPFLGRPVEIIVLTDDPAPLSRGAQSPPANWNEVTDIIRSLEDYDFQAQPDQDACDLKNAEDHLR